MSVTVASSSLEIHHPHLMQTEGLVPTGTRAAPCQAASCPSVPSAGRPRPFATPLRSDGFLSLHPRKGFCGQGEDGLGFLRCPKKQQRLQCPWNQGKKCCSFLVQKIAPSSWQSQMGLWTFRREWPDLAATATWTVGPAGSWTSPNHLGNRLSSEKQIAHVYQESCREIPFLLMIWNFMWICKGNRGSVTDHKALWGFQLCKFLGNLVCCPSCGPRTSLWNISFPSSLTAAQKTRLLSGGMLVAGHARGRDVVSAKVVPAQGKAKGCSASWGLISTHHSRVCTKQLFSPGW